MKIAIFAYDNSTVGQYDPEVALEKGVAGSEEAIVYGSHQLANTWGQKVHVYANPRPNTKYTDPGANPRYFHYKDFYSTTNQYDIVICWRRLDTASFEIAKQKGKRIYGWYHDLPGGISAHGTNWKLLNGIYFLTKFHQKQFYRACPSLIDIPCILSGNGIEPDQFPIWNAEHDKTNPLSCVYCSNWSRGLEELADAWPILHRQFPTATLEIFYGDMVWNTMSQEAVLKLKTKLKLMSETMNVKVTGMVGHLALAQALTKASFLLYPCKCFAETFCIVVCKAAAAGCIPITTRIGALDETLHPDVPVAPFDQNTGKVDMTQYVKLVLEQFRRVLDPNQAESIQKDRLKFREFVMSRWTWEKWSKMILEFDSPGSAALTTTSSKNKKKKKTKSRQDKLLEENKSNPVPEMVSNFTII